MFCLWKHIYRLQSFKGKPPACQVSDIAGLGGRIAGYVDDAFGFEGIETREGLLGAAGPWRVK